MTTPLAFMLGIFVLGVFGLAAYRIFQKAGYQGTTGLALLVPYLNIIPFLYLAFAKWPIQEQAERFLEERNEALRQLRLAQGESLPAAE